MLKKIIILITITFLLQSCLNLKQPAISFQKSETKLLSFQEAEVKFYFNLANDNIIPLNGKINYELLVNNISLFNGASTPIEVGSNSSTEFYLSNKVDLIKIFSTINNLLAEVSSGKKSIPLELKGSFKTQAGLFPLETPINIKENLPLPTLEQVLGRK